MNFLLRVSTLALFALVAPAADAFPQRQPDAVLYADPGASVTPQFGNRMVTTGGVGLVQTLSEYTPGTLRNGLLHGLFYGSGDWRKELLDVPVQPTDGAQIGHYLAAAGGEALVTDRANLLASMQYCLLHVFELNGRHWGLRGIADFGQATVDRRFVVTGMDERGAILERELHAGHAAPDGFYTVEGLDLVKVTRPATTVPTALGGAVANSERAFFFEGCRFRFVYRRWGNALQGGRWIAVLEQQSDGRWAHVGTVTPSPTATSTFGFPVAATDEWLAVHGPRGCFCSSRLQLFRRAPGEARYTFHSEVSNPRPFVLTAHSATDSFGAVAAFSGDRLVVGAYQQANQARTSFEGGAYVFEFDQSSDQWTLTDELTTPTYDTGLGGRFGWQVGFIGGAAVVTDPTAVDPSDPTARRAGAVYIYEDDFTESRCAGTPDAGGQPATLEVTGHNHVLTGGLRLRGSHLAPGQTYAVLASLLPGPTPLPGLLVEDLCIGFPRIPLVGGVGTVAADGTTDDAFDLGEDTLAGLDPSAPLHLQLWFRRPAGAAAAAGVSNGVTVELRADD